VWEAAPTVEACAALVKLVRKATPESVD